MTALAAGDGGSGVLQKLRAAMQQDHPVIRYWGATGCTIQGKAAATAGNQLKKLLEDPSPSVRVAAAEALYVIGDKQTGFPSVTRIGWRRLALLEKSAVVPWNSPTSIETETALFDECLQPFESNDVGVRKSFIHCNHAFSTQDAM